MFALSLMVRLYRFFMQLKQLMRTKQYAVDRVLDASTFLPHFQCIIHAAAASLVMKLQFKSTTIS
jgi:hypothetical protein